MKLLTIIEATKVQEGSNDSYYAYHNAAEKWAKDTGQPKEKFAYAGVNVQDEYIEPEMKKYGLVPDSYQGKGVTKYRRENTEEGFPDFKMMTRGHNHNDKTCPVCKGSGNEKSYDELNNKPGHVYFQKPKPKCPRCDGTGKKIEEGEERSIIADACVEKLVDKFRGEEHQFENLGDLEYAIYSELERLDVEDCIDPDMEHGGQRIGDFASGGVLDVIDSSSVIDDVMAQLDVSDLEEGKSPHKKGSAKYKKHMAAMHAESQEGRWAIYIDDKDTQVRFKSYADAGEMQDKMEAKHPSKKIELKSVGVNEAESNMIGEPDRFYDAEQRKEAYNDLQNALAQSSRVEAEYVKDGQCPECPNVEDDEDCYGFGNYGCDDGELTYNNDTVSWKEIKDHDERQAQRQSAKDNYPGDEAVIDFAATTAKQLKASGKDPRDTLEYVRNEYPGMGRAQRASLVAKGMKKAGLIMNENKWKELPQGKGPDGEQYFIPVTLDNMPLDWPTYWEWEQSHGETNKNRASLRYGGYVDDAKSELGISEGEKHGNSKIYKKCWTGYSKVPGKKAGEKGSCKKNEGRIEDTFGTDTVDKHDKPKKKKKEESIQAGDELMIETADGEGIVVPVLHVVKENVLVGWDELAEDIVVEGARQLEELRKLAGLDQINEINDESAKEVIMQILNSYGKDADLETEFKNYFPRLSDDEVDHYLKKYKKPELKLVKNEAEYQGRKVKLGKPTRGDVKKFKVYVKDPKTGNVKKVNFGHGGTSAKKAGQKTMKIKKSNPARRKSFRARHNCDNPGPRTKARYWSCRAW